MNKICTDIDQSKKLIELGINVNTADMFWLTTDKPRLHILVEDLEKYSRWDCTPAWSLSALLELIPSTVFLYSKLVKWDGSYYIEHREMLYDNPIDAAFEMIVWLKENNKL